MLTKVDSFTVRHKDFEQNYLKTNEKKIRKHKKNITILEPLHISVHTLTCSKYPPEHILLINVTSLCYRDCVLVGVFKPKRSDFFMLWDGHLGRAFQTVEGPLRLLTRCFGVPIHTVIATEMSIEPEVCLYAEPNIIKEVRILFNLDLEPAAHH